MTSIRRGRSRDLRPLGLLVALIASLTLVLTACSSSSGGASTPKSDSSTISLKSLMFAPNTLTIKAGTRVTWRNDEPITHTVTSGAVTGVDASSGLRTGQRPDGLFDKKLAGNGDTFSYTFTKPGTYSYYCDIHFGMNAKIVVTN